MVTAIQSLRRLSELPLFKLGRRPSVAVLELASGCPHVESALPFAEQVRRALIRNRVDTSHSEAITGKTVDGVPLEGHEHAHYFAMDEDSDGRLDHVTIYCPRGFDEADVEALASLRTIYRRGNRPDVRMVLIRLGGIEMFGEAEAVHDIIELRAVANGSTSESYAEAGQAFNATTSTGPDAHDSSKEEADRDVCAPSGAPGNLFAKSKRWRSVTPISLPRFPYRADGKPRPSEVPEAQLVRELLSRGLPAPIAIKRIDGYQVNGRPLVRWLEFHAQRFNGTHGKGLAGFEIEFAESVAGPLALGFGCHFGLGLFMPC